MLNSYFDTWQAAAAKGCLPGNFSDDKWEQIFYSEEKTAITLNSPKMPAVSLQNCTNNCDCVNIIENSDSVYAGRVLKCSINKPDIYRQDSTLLFNIRVGD